MSIFEQALEEAISHTSYMDVSDLRRLYYGRYGVYVAFSNDASIPTGGFASNKLQRPQSILAHTVEDVVGKKVTTSMYYGHVFRVKSGGKILHDLKSYNQTDLKDDIEALRITPYINKNHLEDAIEKVENDAKIRYAFAKLWHVTKMVAEANGSMGDKFWRRILMDLGYTGFIDQNGSILEISRGRTTILLDFDINTFEIVSVQKHKKDKRQRVIDDVAHKNKLNRTSRNRVAKKRYAPVKKGFLQQLADLGKFAGMM